MVKKSDIVILFTGLMVIILLAMGCSSGKRLDPKPKPDTLSYGIDTSGTFLSIIFEKGDKHNYPLMVFWLEDRNGNFLKTIYVAKSIGKGVFLYGDTVAGFWQPGAIQRPAALPYWGHKRGLQNEFGNYIPSESQPLVDAITGPTPRRSFVINAYTGDNVPKKFKLLMEINQAWDVNRYWINNKYPGNEEYRASGQPALVYSVDLDRDVAGTFTFTPVGHSHYDGSDGSLTNDLSTITSALDIVKSVRVRLNDEKDSE